MICLLLFFFFFFLWLSGLTHYFSVCVLIGALSFYYYFCMLFSLHLSPTLYFFFFFLYFFYGDISTILLDCIACTLDEFGRVKWKSIYQVVVKDHFFCKYPTYICLNLLICVTLCFQLIETVTLKLIFFQSHLFHMNFNTVLCCAFHCTCI